MKADGRLFGASNDEFLELIDALSLWPRIIARGSREFPCFRRAFAQFEPFGSGVKEALVLLRILEKRHSFIHIARSFH